MFWTVSPPVAIIVVPISAAFAATRVDVFEVPVTFKELPKTESAFMVVTLVDVRLEVPATFRVVEKRPAAFITRTFPLVSTFSVAIFARVRTVRDVKLMVVEFIVDKFIVDRFEFPVTFKAVLPKIDSLLRVVAFVVTKLEVPTTFRVAPEIEETLSDVMLIDDRLDAEVTFRVLLVKIEAAFSVVALILKLLAVPTTFRVAPEIEETLSDVMSIDDRLDTEVTFKAVLTEIEESTLMVVTLVVERFEVSVMFILVVKILGVVKAFETYRLPNT